MSARIKGQRHQYAAYIDFMGPDTRLYTDNPDYEREIREIEKTWPAAHFFGPIHKDKANEMARKYDMDAHHVYEDIQWGTANGRKAWENSFDDVLYEELSMDPGVDFRMYPWNWTYNATGRPPGLDPENRAAVQRTKEFLKRRRQQDGEAYRKMYPERAAIERDIRENPEKYKGIWNPETQTIEYGVEPDYVKQAPQKGFLQAPEPPMSWQEELEELKNMGWVSDDYYG